ncbi:hypothetical protein B0I37DRAFT_435097 [Chaetomium sp. MPI-CAGE-AT-0009]|nr:hypothetical protein B0I37DRAFT_435097 [Chaetomium sp. MPI-CAGE-AT-0009]
MVAHDPLSTGRMTRSMIARAATAQPKQEPPGRAVKKGSSRPAETPKPVTKAGKKGRAEPKAKASKGETETEAARPTPRRRSKRQATPEKAAPSASNAQVTIGPQLRPNTPRTGLRAEAAQPPANKPAPRSERRKAADFYEITKAPNTQEGSPPYATPAKPTSGDGVKQPPGEASTTPHIPWDIYGILDSPGTTQAKPKTDRKKRKAHLNIKKQPAKPIRSISRQDAPGAWLKETASSAPLPSPGTVAMMEEDLSGEAEADPHDRTMDADYIPLGPGPMPKIPKLPRAPKKRPKKQRAPGPSLAKQEPECDRFVDPAFADTSYPAPPSPEGQPVVPPLPVPPPPPPVDHAPEADPGIWGLGINTPPQHAIRRAPARPGNVYCETCFRDDVARWLRIRDGVVRVLHLLGGDTALEELRTLSLEAEEAELSLTEEYRESRVSGVGLRSPPPPEYISSSSESEGEEEGPRKGSVAAKKIIVMSDHGQSWEAPHFNEYPSDIVGLVLLRILAERPTSGLDQAQKDELSELLEGLRQDVGIGLRFFQAMTTVGKSMVVRWRTTRLPKGGPEQPDSRGKTGHWWWEFDDTLQTAQQEVSAETHLPSLFAITLANKARDASLGALTAKEAATAPKQAGSHHGDTLHLAVSLAELERALGMAIPSNAFLKSIGDKLALAKQQLEPTPQPTSTKQKPVDPAPRLGFPPPPTLRRRTHPHAGGLAAVCGGVTAGAGCGGAAAWVVGVGGEGEEEEGSGGIIGAREGRRW